VARGLADKSRTVRLPVHVVERVQKINRAERTLTLRLARDPTDEEIAKEARLPIAQVLAVRSAARSSMSLDEPIGDDGESSVSDLLADENALDPSDVVAVEQRNQALSDALDALPQRARMVLVRRYGLDGEDPYTLDEIARELGLTRERVRQIEVETLRQLSALRELQDLRMFAA
jgi:RNA polymerase sigma factor (sigma-70 family)